MKKLHMLSLASALVIGAATTGFAATNADSNGGSNASPNPSSTTITPGTTTGVQNGSTMTSQSGPYATPGVSPHAATVGPTGSMTRDANNPQGAQRPAGGDNGSSSGTGTGR